MNRVYGTELKSLHPTLIMSQRRRDGDTFMLQASNGYVSIFGEVSDRHPKGRRLSTPHLFSSTLVPQADRTTAVEAGIAAA